MAIRAAKALTRLAALATLAVPLAGCPPNDVPIGYTPTPSNESGRADAPPLGGGGIDFGAKLETVRAKCASERGQFKHAGQVSTCTTEHADVGATRITLVEYCSGGVCRVHSVLIPGQSDARSWLVPYEVLRRELAQRFGTADGNETQFPADCETGFADCVRSGRAWAMLRWRWDDGHAVVLRIGTTKLVPASISVSYAAPGAPSR